jgi:UTP--glucose-1-phosphate uridylyltransferase
MEIKKALITIAGTNQRKLALQTIIDRSGEAKSVLEILIDESRQAGIEDIGVVIHTGDKNVYAEIVARDKSIHLIEQDKPLGYGYAVLQGSKFIGQDYFLHLVGDHLSINRSSKPFLTKMVKVAKQNNCSVSAVTPTRENLLPNFGTIGGKRIKLQSDLYLIDQVVEKPSPTIAEQKLIISGMRAGYYLCFFGMHVLSPRIFPLLNKQLEKSKGEKVGLSESLSQLSRKEQYIALETNDSRIDIGERYGLLKAQLALALSGNDRGQILSELLELFVSNQI